MILNSTKFGGNQTKDVEVGPDRQTGRFLYTPPNYVCGGYNENMALHYKMVASPEEDNLVVFYYLLASEIWPHQRGGLW